MLVTCYVTFECTDGNGLVLEWNTTVSVSSDYFSWHSDDRLLSILRNKLQRRCKRGGVTFRRVTHIHPIAGGMPG